MIYKTDRRGGKCAESVMLPAVCGACLKSLWSETHRAIGIDLHPAKPISRSCALSGGLGLLSFG